MRHAFLGIVLVLIYSGPAQADVLSDCKKIPFDDLQATRALNACTTIIDNTSEFGTAARAQAYNSRGGLFVAHFDKKDYRRAVADYTSSLSLDPSSANTYFNRAHAHELMGQHQIALQDYKRAIWTLQF